MNLYKVRVYSIGYDNNLGNDRLIDTIIVKKELFGVEEIISKWPIRVVSLDTIGKKHPDSYLRPYAYKEFGYDLAVLKEDLISENIINKEEMEKYISKFDSNPIKNIFERMQINFDFKERIIEKRKSLWKKKY